MARTAPNRNQRRRTFLRCLADGHPVAQASAMSRVGLSTLYVWRRDDDAFRAAWDEAAAAGEEARAARYDGELMRRAVEGVDEPVFHAGEAVGSRKRYSDSLLVFGIRDLREQRKAKTRPFIAHTPRVTVVIEPLEEEEEPLTARQLENKHE